MRERSRDRADEMTKWSALLEGREIGRSVEKKGVEEIGSSTSIFSVFVQGNAKRLRMQQVSHEWLV